MKFFLSLMLLSLSQPSFGQISNNEKTAWTGGYIYGFAASLCQAKSLGYINEKEFNNLSEKIVNFYKDNLEVFAYSPDSTTKLYELRDGKKLDQVCEKFEWINK